MNICLCCNAENPPEAYECTSCGNALHLTEAVSVFASTLRGAIPARSSIPEFAPATARPTLFMKAPIDDRVIGATANAHTPVPSGRAATATLLAVDQTTAQPRRAAIALEVLRGEKPGVLYPILRGKNLIGRCVDSPVDIDLTGQEPEERVWTSRFHATVFSDGQCVWIEDANSLNGTHVNRVRLYPGTQKQLQYNDVIQLGVIQLRVRFGDE